MRVEVHVPIIYHLSIHHLSIHHPSNYPSSIYHLSIYLSLCLYHLFLYQQSLPFFPPPLPSSFYLLSTCPPIRISIRHLAQGATRAYNLDLDLFMVNENQGNSALTELN